MIGKITKVSLREIWRHEAYDFTKWLTENIDVLNNVLSFQLLNPESEKKTENFSVDIVAEDENGNIVIIENQLEKSNHDHLGKLITYFSAVGASKAIWIVSEPRAEHIKAISWLNESSSADFYLLKIEGIKIGSSDTAPLLTLIVGPSQEVKDAGETKKVHVKRHALRKEFWTFLLDKAKEKTKLHSNMPSSYGWIGTKAVVSGLSYNYVIGQHDSKVELYIDKDKENGSLNKTIFDMLKKEQVNIDTSFGEQLSWEKLEEKRASRIVKYYNIGGYEDKEQWDIICETMIDGMINLEKAFSPILNKIKTKL